MDNQSSGFINRYFCHAIYVSINLDAITIKQGFIPTIINERQFI